MESQGTILRGTFEHIGVDSSSRPEPSLATRATGEVEGSAVTPESAIEAEVSDQRERALQHEPQALLSGRQVPPQAPRTQTIKSNGASDGSSSASTSAPSTRSASRSSPSRPRSTWTGSSAGKTSRRKRSLPAKKASSKRSANSKALKPPPSNGKQPSCRSASPITTRARSTRSAWPESSDGAASRRTRPSSRRKVAHPAASSPPAWRPSPSSCVKMRIGWMAASARASCRKARSPHVCHRSRYVFARNSKTRAPLLLLISPARWAYRSRNSTTPSGNWLPPVSSLPMATTASAR